MIQAIMLNPKKGSRWTTKGINLSVRHPVAQVPDDLEEEFLERIRSALASGEILEVDSTRLENIKLEEVGELESIEESDIDQPEVKVGRVLSEPDELGRRKVNSYFLQVEGDPEAADESAPKDPIIILTDIEDEHEDVSSTNS
jgi:hypothetical protein